MCKLYISMSVCTHSTHTHTHLIFERILSKMKMTMDISEVINALGDGFRFTYFILKMIFIKNAFMYHLHN
jgi:hypothetical protein